MLFLCKTYGGLKMDLTKKDLVMTSRELAELTGKRHDNVMRDIRKEKEKLDLANINNELIFELVKYKDVKGELRDEYSLSKDGVMMLAMKYDTITRYKITQKLNELENKIKLPGTYKEALLALVAAEEIKEQQQLLITEQTEYIELAKPKVEVYDAIIKTEGNYSFKYVAGLLGVSKSEFVRKLKWLRIISETNEPFYEYRITKQYFRTFFSKNWYVTPEGIIFLTKKFKTMDDNKAW